MSLLDDYDDYVLDDYVIVTTCYGLETISFQGSRLWQALPNDMKQSDTLATFKRRIKTWKGEECNCRLCRPFVAQVGFLSG